MKDEDVCGFCKQGSGSEAVCGKLWKEKECVAHQRCMQYSALLVQYNMKKFGGFKVKKVMKEMARGKSLKCYICGKSEKNNKLKTSQGATAGCAISRCKKSFHLRCVRLDRTARSRRIEVTGMSGGPGADSDNNDDDDSSSIISNKQILYRVFCSIEHEKEFEKTLKNYKYTDDTDIEKYENDITSSEEEKDEENNDCFDDNKEKKEKYFNKKTGKVITENKNKKKNFENLKQSKNGNEKRVLENNISDSKNDIGKNEMTSTKIDSETKKISNLMNREKHQLTGEEKEDEEKVDKSANNEPNQKKLKISPEKLTICVEKKDNNGTVIHDNKVTDDKDIKINNSLQQEQKNTKKMLPNFSHGSNLDKSQSENDINLNRHKYDKNAVNCTLDSGNASSFMDPLNNGIVCFMSCDLAKFCEASDLESLIDEFQVTWDNIFLWQYNQSSLDASLLQMYIYDMTEKFLNQDISLAKMILDFNEAQFNAYKNKELDSNLDEKIDTGFSKINDKLTKKVVHKMEIDSEKIYFVLMCNDTDETGILRRKLFVSALQDSTIEAEEPSSDGMIHDDLNNIAFNQTNLCSKLL